ncbi:S-adenosyl-L-methionine-dependent methyltransferase [Aspergillus heteromorphus CBS 117.55]|uniref:S-adenosyl-L-methionine-dependent methyltransferase n=1 Tax=Aspergillus heteromorphus CBS 117.55 TaxID=1448321 RepID=A0A317X021_9EURO|nr:S-adenosyl-L-methionine-dependent methyltransferase [Aspergillus heteromorphus CBS 117.55]PWY90897.1 S-adenosyl-L-methionine-dependent methyltransferase [Aspergillus heteromorphus CBS 117.55]
MTTTQVLTENALLARARACLSKEDCRILYAEWAATYNSDLADASQEYVAPMLLAQTALKYVRTPEVSILDAGCGTGLVGVALAQGGVKTIDGLDLSPDMLKMAEGAGVYRNLDSGDLTQQIEKADDTYDIVTCAGTFTHGHVGPDPALREFVRITKKNGFVAATVIEDLWLSGGFEREVKRLEAVGLVKVVSVELKDYRRGVGDKATVIVLEKL